MLRSLLISLLSVLLLSGCATGVAYRPSSNLPLTVSIAPDVSTPPRITVSGLTSAWAMGAGAAVAGAPGAVAMAGALPEEMVAPFHDELQAAVLEEMTAAIRLNPRFTLTEKQGDAEFRFQVCTALFVADSPISSDLKPIVTVRGALVDRRTGRILWSYDSPFQHARAVRDYEEDELRSSPALQAEALRTAVRHACKALIKNLQARK